MQTEVTTLRLRAKLAEEPRELLQRARVAFWGTLAFDGRRVLVRDTYEYREHAENFDSVEVHAFPSACALVRVGVERMMLDGRYWHVLGRVMSGRADGYDIGLVVQFACFNEERYA